MAKGRIRSSVKKIGKKAVTKIASLDAERKLQRYKVNEFEPKVRFSFDKGHYTVKTVENGEELAEALKLRFDAFNKEYFNKKRPVGVDIDKLDLVCDHMMIRDNRIGRIVGTYRLNSSTFSDTFYSTSEFEMDDMLKEKGNLLELGRAAINKEHRTGAVIALLWRGIAEYTDKAGTDVLFGCASVKTMEPLEIGLVVHHLRQKGYIKADLSITPTKKYKVKTLAKVLDYIERNPYEYDPEQVDKLIPTLFHAYMKMGCRVYGEPALDRDFRCIDFMIMMRLNELDSSFRRRYKEKSETGSES